MADDITTQPIVADSLAFALVMSSDAPILLLDGGLSVIAASASFSRAFHLDPEAIPGRSLFALGTGEWDAPELHALLEATLSGAADHEAHEMDLKQDCKPPRRLVTTAHQLDYKDADSVRLLLAVSDVTDARLADRLKDDLLREKAILFQELQHRVANSLHIIASVLMQTARRISSTEARGYLHDAHNRVMSVAALQRQLSVSKLGDVELHAYFTELCESIAASMIHDRDKLTLSVDADNATATADTSVSLGLIVTELTINALKHAFPDGRGGHIVVAYKALGPDWTLSVTDDGVGMPQGPAPTRLGLGTSIVQALARQLEASVAISGANPGTRVSVVHKDKATGDVRLSPASI